MVDRNGRDGEIRTRDLTHPKRARYQAAPRPVKAFKYVCKIRFVKCADQPTGEKLLRGYFALEPDDLVSASNNPNSSRNSEAMRRNAKRSSMLRAPTLSD
jgi:hypothetical protein